MDTSSPAPVKRPCCTTAAASPPPDAVHQLLESLLLSLPSAAPIDSVLECIVDSRVGDSEKGRAVEGAVRLGSSLLEAARRCERRLAARHNAAAWPLPSDLSIKVFSMLDTPSLCYAAGTCSLFNKYTKDPLCYTHIDLKSSRKVNNGVVCTLIQRAGNNLRSLRIGAPDKDNPALVRPFPISAANAVDDYLPPWNERSSRPGKESAVLTRSCLLALSIDGGTAGALLKSLHLYNIEKMDSTSLCTAISACHSLTDLELIGLHVELKQTLESVSTNCHLMERFVFESSEAGRDDSLRSETCIDLVNGCPNISTLALRGLKLHDHKARIFLKGLHNLKVIDFSTSYSITGTFLRILNGSCLDLEFLLLRDCLHLKEVEISRFLILILAGECKNLKYLDISNRDGLSSDEDWYDRCYNPSTIPIARVLELRPEICLVAEFPMERSFTEIDEIFDDDLNGDLSLSLTPDSLFITSSESSYSSDQVIGDYETSMNFAVLMDGAEDDFRLHS